jgi:hypothetical protein
MEYNGYTVTGPTVLPISALCAQIAGVVYSIPHTLLAAALQLAVTRCLAAARVELAGTDTSAL